MTLTEELKQLLLDKGAELIGIGDLAQLWKENALTVGSEEISEEKLSAYSVGISIAIPLPKHLIEELKEAPNEEYYNLYHSLNQKLNEIVLAGEEFLKGKGYRAYAQTTDRVKADDGFISPLPHKTVATRAGLGWIGKNCLLVTKEFGPAMRISSLLTDAPLECSEAITESQCGTCELCVKACPAQVLRGTLWKAGMDRSELVDAQKCFDKQVEIMKEKTGIEADLCGKCFAVCKYTQGYLKR